MRVFRIGHGSVSAHEGRYSVRMHHDEFIARTVGLVRDADPELLARAWMHSLDTRDHSLRGAWGAFSLLRHLAKHPFEPSTVFQPSGCAVCGLSTDVSVVSEDDLASARHRYLVATVDWASADLDGFAHRIRATPLPSVSTRATIDRVLDAISALPGDAQLTQLNASLIGTFKSDKYERMRVLEQLGCAGILAVNGHPSYAQEWVRWEDANSRQPRERNKREWAYPVRFWRGTDRINAEAVTENFGD